VHAQYCLIRSTRCKLLGSRSHAYRTQLQGRDTFLSSEPTRSISLDVLPLPAA